MAKSIQSCDDNLPSSCILPQEILINIFERLSVSDIKVCRTVCRSWAWSASIQLAERSFLNFKESLKDISTTDFLSSLSIATFKHVRLRKVSISFSSDSMARKWIWAPVVAGSTSLTLDKCCINERDFIRIITHCIHSDYVDYTTTKNEYSSDRDPYATNSEQPKTSKLKSLSLVDTREMFMSGTLMNQIEDQEIGFLALSNVTKLDISRNSYMTDVLFQRLVSSMPNIETLILNEISIQHHPGIYKKFYPEHVAQVGGDGVHDVSSEKEDQRIFDSPSIFTFGCLLQYLKNKAENIKVLALQGTNLPDAMVQNISTIPQLKLRSLDISKNLGIKQVGMRQLAISQRDHLTELNVSLCRRIAMDYNPNLLVIFENLSSLTKLVLHGISCPRGFDECLLHLKNLEHLDITDCDIPARHLADGIVKPLEDAEMLEKSLPKREIEKGQNNVTKEDIRPSAQDQNTVSPNEEVSPIEEASKICCALKLRVLVLSRFFRAPEQMARILRWTSNLIQINFNGCTLSQETIMQLFRTLSSRGLKELNLNRCDEVGDLGSGSQRTESHLVKPPEMKMPEDVTYKVIRERLCGNNNVTLGSSVYNIGHLSTLTTLKICSNLVSDSTILDAFHFYDLRYIDVSECKNVKTPGFVALAYQNPHLETIIARACDGLDDTGLISIACCLKRLVYLDIESSYKVTSTALSLTSGCDRLVHLQPTKSWCPNPEGLGGCKFLRYLNVSRCPEISIVAVDALLDKLGSPLNVRVDNEETANVRNREYLDCFH